MAINKIINLTQHIASPPQIAEGVVEPSDKAEVRRLITFDGIPIADAMRERAQALAAIAKQARAERAMIGGAGFFMPRLEAALLHAGVGVLYAFSIRESVEVTEPDGTVTKKSTFVHKGFVEIPPRDQEAAPVDDCGVCGGPVWGNGHCTGCGASL